MLIANISSQVGLLIVLSTIYLSSIIIIYRKYNYLSRATGKSIQDKDVKPKYFNPSVVQSCFILFFILCEYLLLDRKTWLEIRGIMMVFSMKLISLVTDLQPEQFPSFIEYLGYMFNSGNVLFGPWISFEHYTMLLKYPPKKNIYWIWAIFKSLFLAGVFLTVSNCWANYLIDDTQVRLLVSYREALSFRTSHYFICYLSQAIMLSLGYKDIGHHLDFTYWKFTITSFTEVEFPGSLAAVVVNWNRPIHMFLKKYIYRKWLPRGRFIAVLMTFVISALFHGLELKVTAVLISLGLFSFMQMNVREFLASTFDICCKVYPCRSCSHRLKRNSLICRLILLLFSIYTVLDLIYVGVLMDPSTDEVGIYTKWSDLYFYSFWLMFLNFLLVF
ncbi:protein-serine O-palmitoleoyltransferase porcupine isoform X2 [Anthonomus grandis grandis]|nr:protein-serine O-palmitoleoyltransferase porcupine isoform X2 [Anthonomus grandis grandis]